MPIELKIINFTKLNIFSFKNVLKILQVPKITELHNI